MLVHRLSDPLCEKTTMSRIVTRTILRCIKNGFILVASLLFFVPSSTAQSTELAEQLDHARKLYFSGDLTPAREMFLKLEAQAPAEAAYYLALLEKRSDEPDHTQILTHLTRAAELGHAAAMWELGQAYELGNGVAADLLRAVDWYRASRAASARTSERAAFFQERDGNLVARTPDAVIMRLNDLATRNDVEAQHRLAEIYDSGELVTADPAMAFKWYSEAAENGHSYSQFMLGYFYCRGIGTEAKAALADHWLARSSRQARCNP